MADFESFQRNCLSIDVWELLTPIIKRHWVELLDLNKSQLWEGKKADGKDTKSYAPKSYDYVMDKISRGVYNEAILPSVNLYNHGDFYNDFKASIMDFGVEIESLDDKAEELENKYSSQIYGLTDESLEEFTSLIVEEYVTALENAMLKD